MKLGQTLGAGPRHRGCVRWKPVTARPRDAWLSEPGEEVQSAGGPRLAQRGRVCLGGGRQAAPLSRADGRGFYHQHPGRQLLSPPYGGPLAGGGREECGRNARCSASLQCWRKMLSSGPGASSPVLPSQVGPRPGSQLSLPKLCKFEHLGPSMGPGRRGRQGAKMLESCSRPAL